MKKFENLTPQGQTKRLNKYAKERAERGTQKVFGRVVRAAKINEIKDGARQAVVTVASYDPESKETSFVTVMKYISGEKVTAAKEQGLEMSQLESYYAGLEKGDLVDVEFKQNGDYNNVYDMFTRKKRSEELAEKAAEPAQENAMLEV